jgi:hypothetical protein
LLCFASVAASVDHVAHQYLTRRNGSYEYNRHILAAADIGSFEYEANAAMAVTINEGVKNAEMLCGSTRWPCLRKGRKQKRGEGKGI